jgi:hypothetical protein
MSNSNYIHVGVYVECINPVSERPIMRKRCEQMNCLRYGKITEMPFCGGCGAPTAEFQSGVDGISSVNPWGIEIDQMLSCQQIPNLAGADVWLPNIGGKAVEFPIDLDYSDVIDIPDPTKTRAAHIAEFEQYFGEAVQGLRAAYGDDNVTVKWGIVTYSM